MSDKSVLCLFCGRYTQSKALDGLADCDRPECIAKRTYEDDFDKAGGIKTIDASGHPKLEKGQTDENTGNC